MNISFAEYYCCTVDKDKNDDDDDNNGFCGMIKVLTMTLRWRKRMMTVASVE